MKIKTRKISLLFIYICFLLMLVEIVTRTEWTRRSYIPFFSSIHCFYYPELREVPKRSIHKNDNQIHILLLGASVVNDTWGNIAGILSEKIKLKTNKIVNVYNLSHPAQTSLDSYYKYRQMYDKHFDIVILYNGINELRLNNCPDHVFKNDYSHFYWYRVVNLFENNRFIPGSAIIYSFYYRLTRLQEIISSPPKYIPKKLPREEWLPFGNKIKTAVPFRTNVENILDIASKKQEPVILMSFAFYVPDDYSFDKFMKKSLDYSTHDCPIELWGMPENIISGLRTHNRIIKDLSRRPEVIAFVDQQKLIPKNGQHFKDICHFTPKGCEKFVDNILESIPQFIKENK